MYVQVPTEVGMPLSIVAPRVHVNYTWRGNHEPWMARHKNPIGERSREEEMSAGIEKEIAVEMIEWAMEAKNAR